MRIEAVMTRDVITMSPETPIHIAAKLMVDHGVSGLPVIDDHGRLVGIISEGDLILRQKTRTKLPWWHSFFHDGERLAREYQKAVGTTVGEVMTRSVVSISPAFGIETAAAILDARGVRRLPVVRDGQLVGIVSRGDLVKALAATVSAAMSLSDGQLVTEMKLRMQQERWTPTVGLSAQGGLFYLWGLVPSATEKSALEMIARTIEGCRGVENHLIVKAEIPHYYDV